MENNEEIKDNPFVDEQNEEKEEIEDKKLEEISEKIQIEDDEDFVMVMPRLQSSVKSVDKTVDRTVDKTACDSTNERILNLLATNPQATQEELARVLGLSVRGIEYAIGTLKKAKRIRKVGGKRFGHWEVIG